MFPANTASGRCPGLPRVAIAAVAAGGVEGRWIGASGDGVEAGHGAGAQAAGGLEAKDLLREKGAKRSGLGSVLDQGVDVFL